LGISCGFGGGGGGSRTVQTVDCWRLGSSSNSPNDVGAGGCGSRTV
jgi:hypothetical protein